MTDESTSATLSTAGNATRIAAPQASDALAGVFRAAFGATDEVPDDFRAILARIDRCETSRH